MSHENYVVSVSVTHEMYKNIDFHHGATHLFILMCPNYMFNVYIINNYIKSKLTIVIIVFVIIFNILIVNKKIKNNTKKFVLGKPPIGHLMYVGLMVSKIIFLLICIN